MSDPPRFNSSTFTHEFLFCIGSNSCICVADLKIEHIARCYLLSIVKSFSIPAAWTIRTMSFLGGAECSTAGNPLTQFTKHVQDDKSLQRDRLVGRSPGGMQEGMRSRGMMGGSDQVGSIHQYSVILVKLLLWFALLNQDENIAQVPLLTVNCYCLRVDDGRVHTTTGSRTTALCDGAAAARARPVPDRSATDRVTWVGGGVRSR